ncbi:hypothetical protein AURANDRAFT_71402, partial [Aureococcus anophagefferens]
AQGRRAVQRPRGLRRALARRRRRSRRGARRLARGGRDGRAALPGPAAPGRARLQGRLPGLGPRDVRGSARRLRLRRRLRAPRDAALVRGARGRRPRGPPAPHDEPAEQRRRRADVGARFRGRAARRGVLRRGGRAAVPVRLPGRAAPRAAVARRAGLRDLRLRLFVAGRLRPVAAGGQRVAGPRAADGRHARDDPRHARRPLRASPRRAAAPGPQRPPAPPGPLRARRRRLGRARGAGRVAPLGLRRWRRRPAARAAREGGAARGGAGAGLAPGGARERRVPQGGQERRVAVPEHVRLPRRVGDPDRGRQPGDGLPPARAAVRQGPPGEHGRAQGRRLRGERDVPEEPRRRVVERLVAAPHRRAPEADPEVRLPPRLLVRRRRGRPGLRGGDLRVPVSARRRVHLLRALHQPRAPRREAAARVLQDDGHGEAHPRDPERGQGQELRAALPRHDPPHGPLPRVGDPGPRRPAQAPEVRPEGARRDGRHLRLRDEPRRVRGRLAHLRLRHEPAEPPRGHHADQLHQGQGHQPRRGRQGGRGGHGQVRPLGRLPRPGHRHRQGRRLPHALPRGAHVHRGQVQGLQRVQARLGDVA